MADVAGTATTFNLPNYRGELYHLSPKATPLLSMIGGITGGKTNSIKEDVWSTEDNADAEQSAALEGADPTYSERDRGEASNVKQIYQYGFSVTYTKQAAVGNMASDSLDIEEPNQVRDELSHQRRLKMDKMAKDVEFTFLNGVYAKPANNAAPRKTRGVLTAITSNVVAAGSSAFATTHLDDLMRQMVDAAAPLNMPVLMCNSWQKQALTRAYGYAPESRNYGGLNIQAIETDFEVLGIVYNRYVPTTTIALLDLAHIVPTHLSIPGKGDVFVEPKPATGSSWNFMLYGEIGLEYGPEQWHGAITGLADS